jgi:uncharacterized protein (DUF2252 family)
VASAGRACHAAGPGGSGHDCDGGWCHGKIWCAGIWPASAAGRGGGAAEPLRVQLCGDAHLSSFGAFASPERRLVFDVNDFDETLPGPFEWDVKRLAASLAVAGRDNGFGAKTRRKIVLAAAAGYRTAMRAFARQPLLDIWYAHLDIEQAIGEVRAQVRAERFTAAKGLLAKAHTRDSTQALGKLTTMAGGRRRIISDPPMIVPVETYADRNERDYAALQAAVKNGKAEATTEI